MSDTADREYRLVVGFDGSDGSRLALIWAAGEARHRNARLEIDTSLDPRRIRNKRGNGSTRPPAPRQGRRSRPRPAAGRRRCHHRRTRPRSQSAPTPGAGCRYARSGVARTRRFHRAAPRLGRPPRRHPRQCPHRRYRATLRPDWERHPDSSAHQATSNVWGSRASGATYPPSGGHRNHQTWPRMTSAI